WLNTIEIHLPPLRERREDIPLLANHFLAQHARRYGRQVTGFEPEAMRALLAHPWPGNVRELEHTIERAVLLTRGESIRLEDLGLRARPTDGPVRLEEMPLAEAEKHLIRLALERYDGNV